MFKTNGKQVLVIIFFFFSVGSFAQVFPKEINWTADGNSYLKIKDGGVVRTDVRTNAETVLITKQQLTPAGGDKSLSFRQYNFSADNSKLLVYTNSAKVWRYNTRGDYWVLDIPSNKLTQLGKGRPSQSLMFAKISPDNKKVGYVSEHNIYVEDIATHQITQLTKDGTRKFINGTFDWVYEEEFGCRDGFRWSPDSRSIAFWQVDATKIRDYYMLNTTDSIYSRVVPVEYPKVGEPPSPVRIGVINVSNATIKWMNIPGDPQQHYLPRMEWAGNANELIVQQLNRKQNESKLFYCNANTGTSKDFYTENDKAWIDIKSRWNDDDPTGWDWLQNGDFLWVSEKDGWRHISRISRDGKKETLVTKGNYDIDNIKCIDEAGNYVYFMASPDNATELYLYKTRLDGNGPLEMVSPKNLQGTHDYNISPGAKFALHNFSNYKTFPDREWISLPDHNALDESKSIERTMRTDENTRVEYFKLTTEDNITVDGWVVKPANFDSTKKYPVVFTVYTEPAATTTNNSYGAQRNFLFDGDMSGEGYFQVSLDNRGTPALKGAAWRKSIYRKIGIINIHDQAMAAKKFLDKPYFDKDRIAVWGWSGGGSATLNLLFQHPEIYKTGIAIAAVGNQLFYDNIYQERYMGLPQENRDDFVKGSPIYYAKNLQGNLLYIHGTGDDNVHFDNAEVLVNELIKYNKQFQYMPYPNRTHAISEGEGTRKHLSTLYSSYLRKNCPGGAR
ncbi:MAG: S9 family peptidase [Chitinophagaceae bacterium]|nr:S9 family peptidase [Chitinophagaceae bacterium]